MTTHENDAERLEHRLADTLGTPAPEPLPLIVRPGAYGLFQTLSPQDAKRVGDRPACDGDHVHVAFSPGGVITHHHTPSRLERGWTALYWSVKAALLTAVAVVEAVDDRVTARLDPTSSALPPGARFLSGVRFYLTEAYQHGSVIGRHGGEA